MALTIKMLINSKVSRIFLGCIAFMLSLPTIPLGPVLAFRLSDCLPLHVRWNVGTATCQHNGLPLVFFQSKTTQLRLSNLQGRTLALGGKRRGQCRQARSFYVLPAHHTLKLPKIR